jgi:hypothetical protein
MKRYKDFAEKSKIKLGTRGDRQMSLEGALPAFQGE